MIAIAQNLWREEDGVILSAELIMILTIGVLGLIVGLVNIQNALLSEFNDLGGAFRSLNQSYATPSFRGCWKGCWLTAYTAGSGFVDLYEPGCMTTDVPANSAAGCYGLELNSGYGCYVPPSATTVCPAPATSGLATPSVNPVPQDSAATPGAGTEQILKPRTP